MAYRHAKRTLAAGRLLEAETAALLAGLPQFDAEQSSWLQEPGTAGRGCLGPKAGMHRSTGICAFAAVIAGPKAHRARPGSRDV